MEITGRTLHSRLKHVGVLVPVIFRTKGCCLLSSIGITECVLQSRRMHTCICSLAVCLPIQPRRRRAPSLIRCCHFLSPCPVRFFVVLADARGDVFRGLEVVEQACGVGVAMMGETLAGVAKGMDTHSYREPLGVCAGELARQTLR